MTAADRTVHLAGIDQVAGFDLADAPLEGGGVLLTVRGELDVATAPLLRERLAALMDAGVRCVVLDLVGVSFMDSISVAVLVRARMRLGDEGTMVVVIAPDSYARLIFEVAGIPSFLEVVETLDEGVRRIR